MENPHAPRSDPHREVSHFLRSRQQDNALGFYTDAEVNNATTTTETEAVEAAAEKQEAASASSTTASTTSSTLLLRCQEGEVGDEKAVEATGTSDLHGLDSLESEVALPRVLSASTTSTALGNHHTTASTSDKKQQPDSLDLTDEVLNFPTNCPECSSPADTKMKVTSMYLNTIILYKIVFA